MQCYNCKKEVSDSKFCPNCGFSVKQEPNYVEQYFNSKELKCWNCDAKTLIDDAFKERYRKFQKFYCTACAVRMDISKKQINFIKKTAKDQEQRRILSKVEM